MRSTSTSCSQNTLRSNHSGNVIWRSFFANQKNFLSCFVPFFCFCSCKYNLTTSSTRRCVKTRCNFYCICKSCFVESRVQKLVDVLWFNTVDSHFFCNKFFSYHVYSHLNGSSTCTFTVAALEHIKFTLLDSKFHILHVFIMFFKIIANFYEFSINFRIFFFKFNHIFWCTDTCNNVFTLCINKVFTIELVFTCRSVTAETYTSTRVITHVTEYHCHNSYSCSFKSFDCIQFAIFNSTWIHP